MRADVKLNPLISPLPEDGSDQVHLNWNMLFPTSMVQRSTDPSHISWSKGRDAPATFPRVSSLRLVSDTIPWVLNVEATDIGIGVTCGEVIDSIEEQLVKFSDKRDYERLTPSLRQEVVEAYRRNRSRGPDVPGGRRLGEGMKRLDFLRQDTMFAGIEVNDRVVKRLCGDVFPCVFVLKCSRLRWNSRSRSRTSSNTRNNVHPPSTMGSQPLPSTLRGRFSSFGNYGPPPQTDRLPLLSPLPSSPWGRFLSFGNYGPPPPQTGSLPLPSPLPSTFWRGFP